MKTAYEDRSIRSERARVALRIFLQRCAVRMGASALVVADGRGRPVACTDESVAVEELARMAPELADNGGPVAEPGDEAPGASSGAVQPGGTKAWPVPSSSGETFLLALWDRMRAAPATSEEITETCAGVARILDSHQ